MKRALLLFAALGGCGPHTEEPTTEQNGPSVELSMFDAADKDCGAKGTPIALWVTNRSEFPTSLVRWSFSATERDHATNLVAAQELAASQNPERVSDRIIKPGETYKICSTGPSLPPNVDPAKIEISAVVSAE
jgi:hypothetical protein